ncbi:MAG: hypothetical protein K9N49_09640, partial [Candidatus Marinimicrobia bacterium]|nr:hypothetical protein [Candidatus Neomarinimicrobiota bacterium]
MRIKSPFARSRRKRVWRRSFWGVLALLLVWPWLVRRQPPLPAGTALRIGPVPVQGPVRFLRDQTLHGVPGAPRRVEQEIFDEMLARIAAAHEFVYLNFFLWNDWQGAEPERHRALATELAEALMARKRAVPDLVVVVQTDPINACYGQDDPEFFERLRAAGISVIWTDLDALPDSNRWYADPARFWGGLLGRWPWGRR